MMAVGTELPGEDSPLVTVWSLTTVCMQPTFLRAPQLLLPNLSPGITSFHVVIPPGLSPKSTTATLDRVQMPLLP